MEDRDGNFSTSMEELDKLNGVITAAKEHSENSSKALDTFKASVIQTLLTSDGVETVKKGLNTAAGKLKKELEYNHPKWYIQLKGWIGQTLENFAKAFVNGCKWLFNKLGLFTTTDLEKRQAALEIEYHYFLEKQTNEALDVTQQASLNLLKGIMAEFDGQRSNKDALVSQKEVTTYLETLKKHDSELSKAINDHSNLADLIVDAYKARDLNQESARNALARTNHQPEYLQYATYVEDRHKKHEQAFKEEYYKTFDKKEVNVSVSSNEKVATRSRSLTLLLQAYQKGVNGEKNIKIANENQKTEPTGEKSQFQLDHDDSEKGKTLVNGNEIKVGANVPKTDTKAGRTESVFEFPTNKKKEFEVLKVDTNNVRSKSVINGKDSKLVSSIGFESLQTGLMGGSKTHKIKTGNLSQVDTSTKNDLGSEQLNHEKKPSQVVAKINGSKKEQTGSSTTHEIKNEKNPSQAVVTKNQENEFKANPVSNDKKLAHLLDFIKINTIKPSWSFYTHYKEGKVKVGEKDIDVLLPRYVLDVYDVENHNLEKVVNGLKEDLDNSTGYQNIVNKINQARENMKNSYDQYVGKDFLEIIKNKNGKALEKVVFNKTLGGFTSKDAWEKHETRQNKKSTDAEILELNQLFDSNNNQHEHLNQVNLNS